MSNTVNAEEVARYNTLANTWWDASGPMWPLHKLNVLRVPFIADAVRQHFHLEAGASLASLSVLDVGCGAGLLSESMAWLGASVTGIDPAEKNIAMATAHAQSQGLAIDYICGDISAVAGRQFDIVLNMEVIEHVEHLDKYMHDCNDAVKVGGMHILATINRNLWSWLIAIVGAEYVLGWLPRGTHRWQQFVKPSELQQLLAEGQCEVCDQAGVAINPFNKQYRLSNNLMVNYMLVASKLNGEDKAGMVKA